MSRPTTWQEALATLAKPIPQKFVKQKPDASRADYVPHHILRQWLHGLFDDHRFETLQVVQKGDGDYALRVRLHVCLNGEWRQYEGWGESDNRKAPLKSAESDAVKRICAMHLGLGLSLWSREHYFLPDALERNLQQASEAAPEAAQYGGDGDELADGESPAPPAPREPEAPPSSGSHPPSTEKVDVPEGDGAEGEAAPSPNGADLGDPSERSDLRGTFFGIIQGAGLEYDKHVRPWMKHHYHGHTLSSLPIDDLRALVAKLNGGSQHDKQDARKRFKVSVQEHLETTS